MTGKAEIKKVLIVGKKKEVDKKNKNKQVGGWIKYG